MNLDFFNIEENIFKNKKLRQKLKDFESVFRKWDIGNIKSQKYQCQRAKTDLLNQLQAEHLTIIEQFYGQSVEVTKINKFVENHQTEVKNAEINVPNYYKLAISRDKDTIKITALNLTG